METLLTKLIEKWRKPFGLWWCPNRLTNYDRKHNRMWFEAVYCIWEDEYDYDYRACSLRQLVSKESWLWQFVCENGMYKTDYGGIIYNWERAKDVFYKVSKFDEEWDVIQTWDMEWEKFIWIYEPEYRLIESALRDEDKLEDFILSNIKLD